MRAIQVCAAASAVYWSLYLAFAPAAAPDVALGWAEVGYLLLSIGLSLAAGYLTGKDNKNPIQDERPTALATRGSYMAWVSGFRRLGYVMTWAGFRHYRNQQAAGGKGDLHDVFNPKQRFWYECAIHHLCVGPANRLERIEADGETIMDGKTDQGIPVTPATYPSGSLVQVGIYRFYIFWGEHDQPKIPTAISSGGKTINIPQARGVDSRWPLMCYVLWIDFPLGNRAMWPIMSYEVGKIPAGTILSDTLPLIEPDEALPDDLTYLVWDADPVTKTITIVTTPYAGEGHPTGNQLDPPAPSGTRLTIETQKLVSALANTTKIRLVDNNGLTDRDLTIADFAFEPPPYSPGQRRLTCVIEVVEDITGIQSVVGQYGSDPNLLAPGEEEFSAFPAGLPDEGYISIYAATSFDGINPAHAIADMLFQPWPSGAGLDQDEWDMDSLEALGTRSEAEGIKTSWVAQDAATVAQRLGAGLQDLSCMIPVNPETGKIQFVPLREPELPLRHLPNKLIVDKVPELEKALGEQPVDFMIFGFPDRANNYRDMTIGRTEDGQIGRLEVARARSIPITITTNFDSAAQIANRREQEELVQNSVWTVETARATRKLLPGEAITADFTNEILRILEVAPLPDSGKVQLKITLDAIGVAASGTTEPLPPIPNTSPGAFLDDLANFVVEIPEYFAGVPPMAVGVVRIRAGTSSTGANVFISADGTSYSPLVFSIDSNYSGGVVATALPADGFFEPEDGTVFVSSISPDMDDVLDLTGSDEEWRLGAQICVLISSAGVEICFLKKLTVHDPAFRTLDGLIRARFGTRRLEHPGGETWAFIVPQTEIFRIVSNFLLIPETTRYFKIVPTGSGSLSLADVDAQALDLYGHGVRPPPVSGLRVTAPFQAAAYDDGDSVTLAWDYATPRTPGTSAGLMPAGQAVGTSDPEGPFLLEILTMANAVVRTENVLTNGYTYTNANILADLGSEVSFKVRITQLRDGFASSTQTLTVEKI